MTYADIILPLPLEGYFTYCVPDTMAPRLQPGCRVRVPLGKTKTYTGLVAALHNQVPAGLKTGKEGVKSIVEMMDPGPVLLPQQLRLWQWIADYYLSPIGDVYKAALPSGLKAEDDYRPKTETYVVLADDFRSAQALRAAQAMLQRAPAQQKVLRAYLELASVSEENPVPQREITREELMNEAHCTTTVLRQFLDRRILRLYEKEVGRIPLGGMPHPEHIKPLSEAQADAYNQILVQQMSKDITLLHGVTSSGKTEIYIHLIQRALDEGRQVLYLLPEIALTVQMMQRLRRVFGDRLGIYHSRYSDAERVEIWKRQLSDHPYDVILGARSALFLPFQRLGLVIVDEEHEQSFKQMDPAPRYHARSAAIILAKLCGAKVLLGTATPSSESYWNAQTGKYGYVRLDKRYQDMALPAVEVVDVKDLRRRKMMTGHFSLRLLAAIRAALASGKQAILFQNRRGFAPRVECHVCGWTPKCPHCDVSLTYHKTMGLLTCHYCGYVLRVPTVCPNCESHDIRGRGFGTERVEDELQARVPEAKIARMDLDTYTHEERLRAHHQQLCPGQDQRARRHADGDQGPRLQPCRRRGHPLCRRHAQHSRLPCLRAGFCHALAGERTGWQEGRSAGPGRSCRPASPTLPSSSRSCATTTARSTTSCSRSAASSAIPPSPTLPISTSSTARSAPSSQPPWRWLAFARSLATACSGPQALRGPGEDPPYPQVDAQTRVGHRPAARAPVSARGAVGDATG